MQHDMRHDMQHDMRHGIQQDMQNGMQHDMQNGMQQDLRVENGNIAIISNDSNHTFTSKPLSPIEKTKMWWLNYPTQWTIGPPIQPFSHCSLSQLSSAGTSPALPGPSPEWKAGPPFPIFHFKIGGPIINTHFKKTKSKSSHFRRIC